MASPRSNDPKYPLRVKIHFVGGPHDGMQLHVNGGKPLPNSIWLPIWPEPDTEGPPYSQARYKHMPTLPGWYEYDRTEEPEEE